MAHHTELLPHRLVMPGLTWPTLAFVGQVTNGVVIVNGEVTDKEARKLSTAINREWDGLPHWFRICFGYEKDGIAEEWLMGDGWQRRVRIAEAFYRSGGFKIESQTDGVLLLRTDR